MMRLDRYIIRHFLMNFGILLTVLIGLFVVMDLIIEIDEFIQAGNVFADEYGGSFIATVAIAADYYVPLVLLLFVFFSGLVAFAAMGFTLIGMARSREIVAMITSGVSLFRIAAPVLLVGILINVATLPVQEYLIPPVAGKIARPKSELKHRNAKTFEVLYIPDGEDNLFSAQGFDMEHQTLNNAVILKRDKQGRALTRIKAVQAVWEPERQAWRLIQSSRTRAVVRSLETPGAATIGEPDAEPQNEYFPTDLSPEVLKARRAALYSRLLSLGDLYRMLGNEASDRTVILRMIHTRFSFVVVNVLLLLIATPFYLLREPRSFLNEGVKAAIVGVSVWGVALVILQFEFEGNPVLLSWLPVILIIPLAAIMVQMVRS